MVRRPAVLIVVCAVALSPSRASAQPPAWTLQWENDAFIRAGDDDDYTNGIRLSVDVARALGWARLAPGYKNCNEETPQAKPCRWTTLIFGQNFYTPRDITIETVQEDERPYAAWLYGGLVARIARPKRLTSVELQIGTTGKWALGEFIQSGVHSLPIIREHSPQPKGWAHEVKPVPGLVGVIASWDDRQVFERTMGSPAFVYADAIPYYRLSVGNVHTHAGAGAIVRLGYNLQRRWTDKIGPSIGPTRTPAAGRAFFWNGFLGVEGRAVAWNALLQHETYTPRRLEPIKRGVLDVEAGFAIGCRRLSGGFRWVSRSPEFNGGRTSRFAGPFITWPSQIR
jgi:lipid A 3-O-deacylase